MQIKRHILHIFLRQTVLFCKKHTPKLSYFAFFGRLNCIKSQVLQSKTAQNSKT